jgi:hypothetical protein
MEVFISILSSGAFISIITYLLTRQKGKQEVRKLKAEAQGDELDNYRKMREIIQTELQPYIDRIAHLEQKNSNLEQKLLDIKVMVCNKPNCQNRE